MNEKILYAIALGSFIMGLLFFMMGASFLTGICFIVSLAIFMNL